MQLYCMSLMCAFFSCTKWQRTRLLCKQLQSVWIFTFSSLSPLLSSPFVSKDDPTCILWCVSFFFFLWSVLCPHCRCYSCSLACKQSQTYQHTHRISHMILQLKHIHTKQKFSWLFTYTYTHITGSLWSQVSSHSHNCHGSHKLWHTNSELVVVVCCCCLFCCIPICHPWHFD